MDLWHWWQEHQPLLKGPMCTWDKTLVDFFMSAECRLQSATDKVKKGKCIEYHKNATQYQEPCLKLVHRVIVTFCPHHLWTHGLMLQSRAPRVVPLVWKSCLCLQRAHAASSRKEGATWLMSYTWMLRAFKQHIVCCFRSLSDKEEWRKGFMRARKIFHKYACCHQPDIYFFCHVSVTYDVNSATCVPIFSLTFRGDGASTSIIIYSFFYFQLSSYPFLVSNNE